MLYTFTTKKHREANKTQICLGSRHPEARSKARSLLSSLGHKKNLAVTWRVLPAVSALLIREAKLSTKLQSPGPLSQTRK
jgi:hypothetical protein